LSLRVAVGQDAPNATMRIVGAVGGEIDLEVPLAPAAKRGRALVSAGTPTIEREHGWTGASG
jgi:hypothetical protein